MAAGLALANKRRRRIAKSRFTSGKKQVEKAVHENSNEGVDQSRDCHLRPAPLHGLAQQPASNSEENSLMGDEEDVGNQEARSVILNVDFHAQ